MKLGLNAGQPVRCCVVLLLVLTALVAVANATLYREVSSFVKMQKRVCSKPADMTGKGEMIAVHELTANVIMGTVKYQISQKCYT